MASAPSAMGVVSRLAYASAEEKGVAADELLQKAGLARQQIDDSSARIDVRNQIRFLQLVAKATDDDFLGFHLAQNYDLRRLGFLYYALASSDRLDQALQRGARFSSVVNEGARLTLREGKDVTLVVEYVDVTRRLDEHQIEFLMTTIVRICRQISSRQLSPQRVSFVHRRKAAPQMNVFLGSDIRFGADVDAVTFSSSIRDIPAVGADPFLNQLLVEYFEEALARRKVKPSSFALRVENTAATLLPHGRARAGEIARSLGVSQRTLARRLISEGQTFSSVLQSLRSDLAKRHLADEDLSISKIAWLLGYQDVSAFTNAFKRWTGKPPRAIRQRMAHTRTKTHRKQPVRA